MHGKYIRYPAIFCAVLATATINAEPLSLEYSAVTAESAEQRETLVMRVRNDELTITGSGSGAQKSGLLFKAQTGEIIFLDHGSHQYTVMSEAWLVQAKKKADENLATMKKKLDEAQKNMSAAQRQQYQQMNSMMGLMPLMGGMMGGDSEAPVYSASSRSSEFNGYKCKQVDESIEGEKTRIFCMAGVETLAIAGQEAETIEQFFRVAARMKAGGVFEFGFKEPPLTLASDQVSGIPVAVSWPDGSGYIAGKVAALDDEGSFTIPSNYLEAKIPLLGM